MAITMTVQQIVDPSKVESELLRLWDSVALEKTRACLFNLIVFNELSQRTDYIRTIVQKVSEKYPCRVLFITHDAASKDSYLKTAVSVVGKGTVACDYIDIGVSGKDLEQVPFLILPHLIPDLSISLLWTEDPCKEHPLFDPFMKLASKVIFDSEASDSLVAFSKRILQLKKEKNIDIADLNWARTEQWRDLIAALFHTGEKVDKIKDVKILYNEKETDFFCHLKVQSIYLLYWLSSQLQWKLKKATKDLSFHFENQTAKINSKHWEKLGSGTIISVDFETNDQTLYNCYRIPAHYHRVAIQIQTPDKCELPFQFILGKTATGQSLAKEIIVKGTSDHYLSMLEHLSLGSNYLC